MNQNKYKEILPDNINAVNTDGDVVPVEIEVDQNTYEPEDEFELTPSASVDLATRAMSLALIMDAYNKQSRYEGARKANERSGVMDKRYKHKTPELFDGMYGKAQRAYRVTDKALDELENYDGLVDAGFTKSELAHLGDSIKEDLDNNYGPGRSNSKVRADIKNKSKKVAGIK